MKYLILGSDGLLGSGLAAYLKSQNHDVIEIDITQGPDHDLRKYDNLYFLRSMQECDFVFFLAFDVGGSKYLKQYEKTFDFISNNVKIMNTVFDALEITRKPFIFASSQMSQMTHSTYGCLKSLGEKYTQVLNGLVVKFWNVYGYEPIGQKSHVVADFIHQALTQNKITMLTDGNEQRQMLHVDDCASALYTLSQHYKSVDRAEQLHITNFCWTTIQEVASTIASKFHSCQIVPGNSVDSVQRGISNEPSNDILKYWAPTISLSDGIEKTIKCYQT
jgi:nucleoside-diphosphate-sugar epimerase